MNTAPAILELALDLIDTSPLNPRRFSRWQLTEEELRPLGDNLRVAGQKETIIVRPSPRDEGRYELANGERRFRAAQLAGLPTLRAEIRELTDAQMLDIMLSTGTQGVGLTPMAEAHGYRERMEMEGLNQSSLAEVLGVDENYIGRRLALLDLPVEAQDAVEAAKLPPSTAWLIATLPGATEREAFAKEVLHPVMQEGPLSARSALALREEKYCRHLRGAPFDTKDAMLVPGAGSCVTCPHRSGNLPDDALATGAQHNCLKPSCFEAKVLAARAKLAGEYRAKGLVPLTPEENARAFPPGEPGVSYKCDLVEYRKPVPRDLLKREVDPAPKWPDICLGPKAVVQVRVGWDQHGLPVELVRVAEAVLAADENEKAIFNEETLRRYNAEAGLETLKQTRRAGPGPVVVPPPRRSGGGEPKGGIEITTTVMRESAPIEPDDGDLDAALDVLADVWKEFHAEIDGALMVRCTALLDRHRPDVLAEYPAGEDQS
jgi:ParB/RepB/Spo0J family partition protein